MRWEGRGEAMKRGSLGVNDKLWGERGRREEEKEAEKGS